MSGTKGVRFKKNNMPVDPTNRYIKFYELVMDAMAGDVELTPSVSLCNEFNMEPPLVDASKLWNALINLDKNAWQKNLDEQNYSNMVRGIVRRFRPYVPDEYKINDSFSPLDKHAETSHEQAKDFIEFMCDCVNRLEDYLSSRYIIAGAKRDLDVLERRYRSNWSNQPVKSIEVKQSDKQDNKLEISIVDA